MRFFDSHCHLEDWMIDEIKRSDTKLVCNIGCDYRAAFEAVEIAKKYDLAPDYDDRLGGELSHIVVMQHVTQSRLQVFLDELKTLMQT